MARYLIVDSRDLTEYTNGRYIQKVAAQLKEDGNDVTLFLIENGVRAVANVLISGGQGRLRVPVDRDHGFRWKMITQSGGT